MRGYFQANSPFGKHSVVAALMSEFSLPGWVCRWKPFWGPCWGIVPEGLLGYIQADDSSDEQGFSNFPALVQSSGNKCYISKTKLRDDAPPAPRPAEHPDALPWEPIGPQDTAYIGKEMRHHCLLYGPDATSSIQGSSVLFLNA